jgi:hypothetical protein
LIDEVQSPLLAERMGDNSAVIGLFIETAALTVRCHRNGDITLSTVIVKHNILMEIAKRDIERCGLTIQTTS